MINWFPGHMKKATDAIKTKIKDVDLIIQVLDARAPKITKNEELNLLFNNKLILDIAMKADLAENISNDDIIFVSINNKKSRQLIIEKINNKVQKIVDNKKSKGYVNPKIYIMVVGLPNVGKTSLINFLLNKKYLIAENKPGVTKKQTWVKISQTLYILDNPGVFFKKITDDEIGYILTLLKCVKWEIVNKYEVIEFAFNYYKKNYLDLINNYFHTDFVNYDFDQFLEFVSNNKNFITKKNEVDLEKTIEWLYYLFSNNKMGKMNYFK